MKDRIAKIMQKEGMTAAQFAEKIGISPSSLSNILRGRNDISLSVVKKIRKSFDYVDWDWLLDGVGEMEHAESDMLEPFSMNENSLFADNWSDEQENRKEIAPKTPLNEGKDVVHEQIRYIEMPTKKITEIRIFFDNGTYETFCPEK